MTTTHRRDPAGMVLGTGVLALFAVLAYWLWSLGGAWVAPAVAAALVALFGTVGFTEAVQKQDRTGSDAHNSP
ncbi:hypothetical protein ACIRPH_30040 [Nocardiopsis sp. NPDC101807]|uniref:hypothetical protein n=1 Tax=Nocardiopsis sp. NPDC101807 TaxID=3364339 RepID=UPI0037FF1AA6